MRVKRWLLAGVALCLLTGMRDPFKPPEDLCRISELSQWRYQGMVGRGEHIIGVIKDGQKKWRRAVSYTHLDVYKRQPSRTAFI